PVKKSRLQQFLQQSMAAQQQRQAPEAADSAKTPPAAPPKQPQQRLGPDGRPRKGSNLPISGARSATPPQRAPKTDDTNGTNGTNRAAARRKGAQPPSTSKAIGAQENPAKSPPPVPR